MDPAGNIYITGTTTGDLPVVGVPMYFRRLGSDSLANVTITPVTGTTDEVGWPGIGVVVTGVVQGIAVDLINGPPCLPLFRSLVRDEIDLLRLLRRIDLDLNQNQRLGALNRPPKLRAATFSVFRTSDNALIEQKIYA